jgi:hypothetical protein
MMLRDHILVSLAGSGMGPAESLVMRANQLVDEACKQWGHAFQRPGEMIVDPPEYCARCGRSAAVISDERATQRMKELCSG